MTRYMKTIVAILGAISTWGITAAADEGITSVEWYGLLGALAAALAVYGAPNTPPRGEVADPNMSEQDPERGQIDPLYALVLVVVIVVLFLLLKDHI